MSALSAPVGKTRRNPWLDRGRELARRLSAPQWEIGDWWLSDDRPADVAIERAADETGLSHAVIWRCNWLARTFPAARRRPALSFSHHVEVASLPDAVADALLEQAEAGRWPVARLRQAARAAAREQAVEAERAAAQCELELEPTAVAWRTDALRVERECRQKLVSAEAALRSVVDAVGALAEHPGADAVHGNRRRAAAERLRGVLASAETGVDLTPHVQPLLDRIWRQQP